MTTLTEAREAIYQKFALDWGNTTVLCFENEIFAPPTNAPWVRVAVRNRASTQETLGQTGNRRFRRLATAFVQIFYPINTGTKEISLLADKVKDIFEGKRINGTAIWFQDVTAREKGAEVNNFVVLVEADFEYTEIK